MAKKRKNKKIIKAKMPIVLRTERIIPERKKHIIFIGTGLDDHMYP